MCAFILISFFVEGETRIGASAKASVEGEKANMRLRYDMGRNVSAEAGIAFFISNKEPENLARLRDLFARVESEDFSFFVGAGKMNDWAALRAKPHASLLFSSGAPWSAEDSGQGNSFLLGLGMKGLRFIAATEAENSADQDKTRTVEEALKEAFRFGGIQIEAEGGAGSWAVSMSIADTPRKVSGDGWRPGASFSPGSTLISLAAAAAFAARDFSAGLWAAGSTGYFECPGLSIALELASSDWQLLLGKASQSAVIGANALIFGSSRGFRTALGKLPIYDFFADMKASLKFSHFSIAARTVFGSLPDDQSSEGGRLWREGGIPPLKALLWLWRTDRAKAALDLGFLSFSLQALALADSGGFRSGSAALRFAQPSDQDKLFSINASFKAAFLREDVLTDEGDELGIEEEMENSLDSWSFESLAAGNPTLRSIDVEGSLKWKGTNPNGWLQRGSFGLAVSADWEDGQVAYAVSFDASQIFRISPRMELTIAIKSPEGGYSLDVPPAAFPSVSAEFSLFDD